MAIRLFLLCPSSHSSSSNKTLPSLSLLPFLLQPDSVVRLDLELVPPLLQKLQQLRQLVDSTQEVRYWRGHINLQSLTLTFLSSQFSFDTNTLMSILVNVETLLRDSILNATRLESRVTG